jgi:hypothetical protein
MNEARMKMISVEPTEPRINPLMPHMQFESQNMSFSL